MSSPRFAFSGIFHVYQEEDGTWGSELIHSNYVDDVVMGDISEDVHLYSDGLEFPQVEGFYSVWAVVDVSYDQDYWGEWSTEYSPSQELITKLSEKETAYFNDILSDDGKEEF